MADTGKFRRVPRSYSGIVSPAKETPRKQAQIAIRRGFWGVFGLRGAPMLDFGDGHAGITSPASP